MPLPAPTAICKILPAVRPEVAADLCAATARAYKTLSKGLMNVARAAPGGDQLAAQFLGRDNLTVNSQTQRHLEGYRAPAD
jgi:hypothetical protein